MSTNVTCRAVTARTHSVPLPDGRTLAVVEDGDPAGAPVIVHHGTPRSGLLYAPWAQRAREQGSRLTGYDRAGYGGASRRPARAVADVAADIDALADALGLERF